jgi:hypothetical protein
MSPRLAKKSVVCSQENIDLGMLGACQVQCIERSKAESFQFSAAMLHTLIDEDRRGCTGYEYLHSTAAFRVRIPPNLEAQHLAADPAPVAPVDVAEDEKDRFRLQADAVLRLVVEGAIEAARIQVDGDHGG